MLKTQEEILSRYNLEVTATSTKIKETKKQVDQFSFMRIGLFLIEILFFVLFVSTPNNTLQTILGFALIIPVIVFVLIVKKQTRLDKKIEYLKQLLWVYQNECNLMLGKGNGYGNGKEFESELHPYTSDLDIFGPASLFEQLNRCNTKNGIGLLALNLAETRHPELILQRQEAVQEIRGLIEDTFDFRANLQGQDMAKIEKIKYQLQNQLGELLLFVRPKMFAFYVRLAPYITFSLLLAALLIDGVFWSLLTGVLIVHTAWNILLNAKVNKVFYAFSGGSSLLNNFASAIRWTERTDWRSAYIVLFFDSKVEVSQILKKLSHIIQNFDARLNILVAGILNAFLLWDFKCCINLNRWHESSSAPVQEALNRIGRFEELISLATLTYNHPEWTFPTIKESFSLLAKDLGHPLIQQKYRVVNHFQVDNRPTVDIITGSNMAGKSTFLRTLGINMVLAYVGAPVCATQMSLSIFKVLTYMRIKDSLNESTSTFKAELNRLKMILDHVAVHENAFVLIDEMLRGTNSRDKYLGSKVFIEKLISLNTPALFATHDLQLADLKEVYDKQVRNYHFDIHIDDHGMHFDYKLKHGACKTFNAAILLKEIGLSLN